MEYCFTKINVKSLIRKELLDFCKANDTWIDPTVGTFLQKKPPQEIIYKDPFLKHICENYLSDHGYEQCVHIFMISPWTHYMMHTDKFRSSSINLLINEYTDSISYFQISEPCKLHIKIKELVYEPDAYYLFNSKALHAITNREPARYLLSITLKDDYENTLKQLQSQNFL